MNELPVATVAYCGLRCADCGCITSWECDCCRAGGGSPGCQVRICAQQRGYTTCAECPEMESCRRLNTPFNRIYDLLFRTHRKENLREIRTEGVEAFLAERSRRG